MASDQIEAAVQMIQSTVPTLPPTGKHNVRSQRDLMQQHYNRRRNKQHPSVRLSQRASSNDCMMSL